MAYISRSVFTGLFMTAFASLATTSCARGDDINAEPNDVLSGSPERGEFSSGKGDTVLLLAEADPAQPPELVPVDEASELRAAGAFITTTQGAMPLLVSGSLRLEAADSARSDVTSGEAQRSEKKPLEQTSITPNLFDDNQFDYKSGFSGTSYDVVVSQKCTGRVRNYASAYAYNNNGGYCSVSRWLTDDPSDCRFIVHVGASAYKHGTCAWSVYADELGYFSYTASNTSSAQQNTVNARIYLAAGQTLTAATCGLAGASASGDTYLRLFDGATQVAQNDDACGGLSSSLVYTATEEKRYDLHSGCFGSGSCSGTVVWVKQP